MKILYIDIETAPHKVYAWGLFKQNVSISQIVEAGYTLCYAAKWHGSKAMMFDSIQESSTKDFVERLWNLLDEADAVVHYNGEKFDIPTLNREFLLNDLPPPTPYHQIDLLKVVRKRFKFASNKLDYVAQALGLGAKVQHMGMELWRQCMEGNAKAWRIMKRYNKQDVALLPKLYDVLLPWIQDHPNHALYTNKDRPVCTNCGSVHVHKKGTETTKTMIYQRYKCADCGTPLRGRTTVLDSAKSKLVLTQSKL